MVFSPEAIAAVLDKVKKPQPNPMAMFQQPKQIDESLLPKDPQQRSAERLNHVRDRFQQINEMDNFSLAPKDDFNYLMQADQLGFKANKLRLQAAEQRAKNAQIMAHNSGIQQLNNLPGIGSPVGPAKGSNRFRAFINAISGQESGGNYGAVNSDSGAAGKYQIMPANFVGPGGWDREALGRDISLQEFLSNPRLQEKIARHKLRQYFQQYGPAGAASAWYSGDPNKINNQNAQGNYPSIYAYVQSILNAMRG